MLPAAIGLIIWPTEWPYSKLVLGEKSGHDGKAIIRLRYRTNRFSGQEQVYTFFRDTRDE